MQVEVGSIVEGKVAGLTNFGAFVTLEDGSTGMVHISEVSNTFVKDIHDFLADGQQVKVKVIGVGPNGKVSLSIKQATPAQSAPEAEKKPPKPQRHHSRPSVWQGQQSSEPETFEDMMAKFKQVSEDKMSDLKRSNNSRFNQKSARRGGRK